MGWKKFSDDSELEAFSLESTIETDPVDLLEDVDNKHIKILIAEKK